MLIRKNNRDFRFAFIPTCVFMSQICQTAPDNKNAFLNSLFIIIAEQGERTICLSNSPIWREKNKNMLVEVKSKCTKQKYKNGKKSYNKC